MAQGAGATAQAAGAARGANAARDVANGNSCFLAGTIILAEKGYCAIEKIKVGDLVYAILPEVDMEPELCHVTNIITSSSHGYYQLTFENGLELNVTAMHPFWSIDKGWVTVIELQPGDICFTFKGQSITLKGKRYISQEVFVYNITVDKLHTYFVGSSGILVHNKAMKSGSRPRNNQAQNKQFDDAVRDAGGLSKDQRRRLHDEAGENNWGYHEIRQRAKEIKEGNY